MDAFLNRQQAQNEAAQQQPQVTAHGNGALRAPVADEAGEIVKLRFQDFLEHYQSEDGNAHPMGIVEDVAMDWTTQQVLMNDYQKQIDHMIEQGASTLYVDFQHIVEHDHELSEAIELEFYRFDPYLRYALHEIVARRDQQYVFDIDNGQREFFVALYGMPRIDRIRAMNTEKIGRLAAISGTVTRSSEVRPELLFGSFLCKSCGSAFHGVEQQFQYTEPHICKNPNCSRGTGDFQILPDKCSFVDWQRLRVQENADEIPAGSMPRCVDVVCRNEIVETAKAGDKIVLTGHVAVVPDTSGLARVGEQTVAGKRSSAGSDFGDGVHGLKKLGVREMTYRMVFVACAVQQTDQRTGRAVKSVIPLQQRSGGSGGVDELDGGGQRSAAELMADLQLSLSDRQDIVRMVNTPHLYNKLVESVCPNVFGHTEVKRGVLLMLFGGVHKKTPEGISLRGDLNVCIVGDPSCAKSQFLKYVHGFLPRTVYTSGKSSSAAGLTASVVRDVETGEFCVEAGALMLADNGICCIDEFDKMDPNDQVAIHEAMEQQTISITKAGIQATLNARTSILAAANPVYGRYDRSKTLKANVAVSAAIMSRFDLFFVILDECNPQIDEAIARHIVAVHKTGGLQQVQRSVPFSREQIQKYIQYARTINPVFAPDARVMLVECYRLLRQNDLLGRNKTAYRITVRQLESLVRLSEGLARLHCDDEVKSVYVREAYRLLQKSIIFVETEDIELEGNEEEMNFVNLGDTGEQYDAAADGDNLEESHSNGDEDEVVAAVLRGASSSSSNANPEALAASEEQKMSVVGEDEASSSQPQEQQQQPPSKKQKSTTGGQQQQQISARDYADMTHMLALRLRTCEEADEAALATDPQHLTGSSSSSSSSADIERPANVGWCKWKDLLAWYLQQFESELVSAEVFEQKRRLVNQVIRRMSKHEGTVMVRSPDDRPVDTVPNEEKLLKLHPSHQV